MTSPFVRLYPASWRDRYGDEFDALLASRPIGPSDVVDIVLGAIDARQRAPGRPDPALGPLATRSLRVGGYVAVSGGVLWATGFALIPVGSLAGLATFFISLAGPALLVALVTLSAFQARRDPALIWAAAALPILAAIVAVGAMVATTLLYAGGEPEWTPWVVWLIGLLAMTISSALFGAATWRIDWLSRRGAALLTVGALASTLPLGLGFAGLWPTIVAWVVGMPGIVAFGSGWVLLGLDAWRRDTGVTVTAAVEP